jgi:hypothetical protein
VLALLEQSSLEILAKETMLVLLLSGLMPEQITQQLGVHRTTGRLQIIVYGDPTKDIDIYIQYIHGIMQVILVLILKVDLFLENLRSKYRQIMTVSIGFHRFPSI